MHANSIKPADLFVNSEMIVSVNFSSSRYRMYLSNKSQDEETNKQNTKYLRCLDETKTKERINFTFKKSH